MISNIDDLQKKLNYKFKDEYMLKVALTHRSLKGEISEREFLDNERLEFLGDSFLNAIISEYLFVNNETMSEGELSKKRALVVCEKSLSKEARNIDLGKFVRLGRGEDNAGGRDKDSILSDTIEAVIGAIVLDGGFDQAKKVVLDILGKTIEDACTGQLILDYKSCLQEAVQKVKDMKISYEVAKEEGPDHDKIFFVDLILNKTKVASGVGRTKKEAEQNAAMIAFEREGWKNVF